MRASLALRRQPAISLAVRLSTFSNPDSSRIQRCGPDGRVEIAPIRREVREGSGNGNGILEPGEEATIWLRLKQGIDPFDKNNWCRAKVYSESPLLEEVGDIQEEKQREWTGAQNRTSVVRLSGPDAVEAILDCESYSFQSSPGVRYGSEPLYQPFQVHRHHLFRWRLER